MASALAAKSAQRAFVARPAASRSRAASRVVCQSGRTTWLPNIETPSYLTGKLAGDFGFDPLGIGADPERLKWYVEGEKTNGRWAMMAVAGMLGQELLLGDSKWWLAGTKEYSIDTAPLTAIEFVVMGFLETKRWQGWKETGSSGLINSFPFDPAGMNSADMQVKEIKNGRLAMVAWFGFCVQALVTRTGPIEGLTLHLSSPFEHNFITNINNLPSLIQ